MVSNPFKRKTKWDELKEKHKPDESESNDEYIKRLQQESAKDKEKHPPIVGTGEIAAPSSVEKKKTPAEELEELELEKAKLEKQLLERQLAASGTEEREKLAELQAKPLREERELKAGLKKHGKDIGLAAAFALIPLVVSYFLINTWISYGVALLPAPVGPLLASLWFVPYAVIYLVFFGMLSQIKSPATIMLSGILMGVIIGLVAWLVNGIFAPFISSFIGPGVYCAFAQLNAQQGGVIPTSCITSQTQQANAQKTGSVNLLSVSFGQSGVPFPSPRQGQQYQFPITISNPSEFDVGPVVIESGYMCGLVGGYPTCGGYNIMVDKSGNKENAFVPNYTLVGTNCVSSDNNCVIGSGGPPLVVSLQGVCANSLLQSSSLTYNPQQDCSNNINGNPADNNVPFLPSYVNLYVNVRYPFTTAGTNDYYIVQTNQNIPKSAPACSGSGTRQLGTACTGAGPLNVIPSFSESYFSLDSPKSLQTHKVYLVIYLSNVGDGIARIDNITVTRFTANGLEPVAANNKYDNRLNCNSPILGNSITEPNNPNNLLQQQGKYYFADGDPTPHLNQTYWYYQNPMNAIGYTNSNLDFLIDSHSAGEVFCYYNIGNVQSSGPSTDVKVQAQVSYDYYESPSKTDILVNQAFPKTSS